MPTENKTKKETGAKPTRLSRASSVEQSPRKSITLATGEASTKSKLAKTDVPAKTTRLTRASLVEQSSPTKSASSKKTEEAPGRRSKASSPTKAKPRKSEVGTKTTRSTRASSAEPSPSPPSKKSTSPALTKIEEEATGQRSKPDLELSTPSTPKRRGRPSIAASSLASPRVTRRTVSSIVSEEEVPASPGRRSRRIAKAKGEDVVEPSNPEVPSPPKVETAGSREESAVKQNVKKSARTSESPKPSPDRHANCGTISPVPFGTPVKSNLRRSSLSSPNTRSPHGSPIRTSPRLSLGKVAASPRSPSPLLGLGISPLRTKRSSLPVRSPNSSSDNLSNSPRSTSENRSPKVPNAPDETEVSSAPQSNHPTVTGSGVGTPKSKASQSLTSEVPVVSDTSTAASPPSEISASPKNKHQQKSLASSTISDGNSRSEPSLSALPKGKLNIENREEAVSADISTNVLASEAEIVSSLEKDAVSVEIPSESPQSPTVDSPAEVIHSTSPVGTRSQSEVTTSQTLPEEADDQNRFESDTCNKNVVTASPEVSTVTNTQLDESKSAAVELPLDTSTVDSNLPAIESPGVAKSLEVESPSKIISEPPQEPKVEGSTSDSSIENISTVETSTETTTLSQASTSGESPSKIATSKTPLELESKVEELSANTSIQNEASPVECVSSVESITQRSPNRESPSKVTSKAPLEGDHQAEDQPNANTSNENQAPQSVEVVTQSPASPVGESPSKITSEAQLELESKADESILNTSTENVGSSDEGVATVEATSKLTTPKQASSVVESPSQIATSEASPRRSLENLASPDESVSTIETVEVATQSREIAESPSKIASEAPVELESKADESILNTSSENLGSQDEGVATVETTSKLASPSRASSVVETPSKIATPEASPDESQEEESPKRSLENLASPDESAVETAEIATRSQASPAGESPSKITPEASLEPESKADESILNTSIEKLESVDEGVSTVEATSKLTTQSQASSSVESPSKIATSEASPEGESKAEASDKSVSTVETSVEIPSQSQETPAVKSPSKTVISEAQSDREALAEDLLKSNISVGNLSSTVNVAEVPDQILGSPVDKNTSAVTTSHALIEVESKAENTSSENEALDESVSGVNTLKEIPTLSEASPLSKKTTCDITSTENLTSPVQSPPTVIPARSSTQSPKMSDQGSLNATVCESEEEPVTSENLNSSVASQKSANRSNNSVDESMSSLDKVEMPADEPTSSDSHNPLEVSALANENKTDEVVTHAPVAASDDGTEKEGGALMEKVCVKRKSAHEDSESVSSSKKMKEDLACGSQDDDFSLVVDEGDLGNDDLDEAEVTILSVNDKEDFFSQTLIDPDMLDNESGSNFNSQEDIASVDSGNASEDDAKPRSKLERINEDPEGEANYVNVCTDVSNASDRADSAAEPVKVFASSSAASFVASAPSKNDQKKKTPVSAEDLAKAFRVTSGESNKRSMVSDKNGDVKKRRKGTEGVWKSGIHVTIGNIPVTTTSDGLKAVLKEYGALSGLLSVQLKECDSKFTTAVATYDTVNSLRKALSTYGKISINRHPLYFLLDENVSTAVCSMPSEKSSKPVTKFMGIITDLSPGVDILEIVSAFKTHGVENLKKVKTYRPKPGAGGRFSAQLEFANKTALLKAIVAAEVIRLGGKTIQLKIKEKSVKSPEQ